MASVNDQIIREYFEMHGFLVRQIRKHVSPSSEEEEESDFWIQNAAKKMDQARVKSLKISHSNIRKIDNALVFVKPWHTESFTHGAIEKDEELSKRLARSIEGNEPEFKAWTNQQPLKILVLSKLPKSKVARDKAIHSIHHKGFDGVLTFDQILSELLDHVSINRNYQRSDLLQVLRILKNYGL
ncbi:MAG: hypothetical protein HOH33_17810, partial [Verrucomicrobia bacterium]|nr:hypothetical protein [Verrucomicrobiota bacterium]